MSIIYVHSSTEYINYGANWTEASGNIVLANDISFTTKQLNDVSLNNLYSGFNATFDGDGYTITITPFSSILNYLNEGLIRDLSGGTIKNINIDISGVQIDYGATFGEASILVTQKKPFNLSIDRGAYGTIQDISLNFTNSRLVNADNSALLPKYFAANSAGNVIIQNIDISGNLNSNNTKCGIIGTDMFYRYNNTATISNITNNVLLTDGISILGTNFGRELGEQATITVDLITNYADISNNSPSKIAGPIIGENAFIDASGGDVSISNCYNYGEIRQENIGGIVGKNFGKNSKSGLNVTVSSSTNVGKIIHQNCGGIIGPYMNQGGYASIEIISCINSGDIEGEYCGGIIASHLSTDSYGNVVIDSCDNSGNIVNATSAGIVANYAGNNMTGNIVISDCINSGRLIGSDVSGSSFVDLNNYPFFHPNPTQDYKAAAGIVGQNCGYSLTSTGSINIQSCKNYGEFVGDFTSGIVSFGLGYGSQGSIQLNDCENFSQMNQTCSGIAVGLIGIDNSGTITFDACKNRGDISGASIENFTSGLIGSIGYINATGNETSGIINVTGCTNENNIYALAINYGGIVGSVYLSPTKNIDLSVTQCTNTLNTVNRLEDDSYIGGIVGYIIDMSSTTVPTALHQITVSENTSNNTTYNITSNNSFYIADSKILGDIFTLVNDGNTRTNINIYDNSVNIVETSPYAFTTGCCNFNLLSNIGQPAINIYNKTVNITGNTINVDKIQTNLELIDANNKLPAYATFSPINAVDCNFTVSDNTITINEVTNSNRVGGILFNFTRDLSNVDMIISSNNITINNVDDNSTNIGGIINISTDLDFTEINGSFENGRNITLDIIGNIIMSNTPETMSNELNGNGTIFSVNTDAGVPTYTVPTGNLTITGNVLSDNFFELEKINLSDYYFPSNFRPYIYNLQPEFAGSNYWFGPGELTIELLGNIFTNQSHQIGSQTDDTLLRAIYKRAINAINEQTRFEIYPFYQIKVKANKM
jgi:hypothetical protein